MELTQVPGVMVYSPSPVLTVTIERQHDANAIEQLFYRVESGAKHEAVLRLLLQRQAESCLIFWGQRIANSNRPSRRMK